MFIGTESEITQHTRVSKLENKHQYNRTRTYALFRCDNCGESFRRLKGSMDPKRLNNNYFHCCSNCDSKRFAQKKGAERRTIWDLPVDSDLDISRL